MRERDSVCVIEWARDKARGRERERQAGRL